jgi:Lrp/AsnC family leucine-responsive transcriptional regulator
MIDEKDLKIMNLLQENARISNAEIARQLEMAPSGVLERLRKLEERGIIKGYEVRLNTEILGLTLAAFVFVRTDDRAGAQETAVKIAKIPEVQEIHDVAGEDCYLVKIRARDTQHLAKLLKENFGKMKSILSTRTTIVLQTIKETSQVPLDKNLLQ